MPKQSWKESQIINRVSICEASCIFERDSEKIAFPRRRVALTAG